jgi:4-hydroxy-4-methyl-2-oxoglutarate aldolase
MTTTDDVRTRPGALPTALVADACLRLKIDFRLPSRSIAPLLPGACIGGPALPARHHGSVDVFLDAIERARPGDVLVIDNDDRPDEACIGDLIALEAAAAGVAGIVVWGAVRDRAELRDIGLPIFCSGLCPAQAAALRPARAGDGGARIGGVVVERADAIFADDDGVLVVRSDRLSEILDTAARIQERERVQARRVREGVSLRQQFRFSEYLARRGHDPDYTFRKHLEAMGGAI